MTWQDDQKKVATGVTQKREWVGLTEEEARSLWYAAQHIMGWYSFQEIANAVEAKLKEKNEAH